jgi:hypothetical protein
MVPAFTALAQTSANPVRRFGAVYVGMGMNMAQWIPEKDGALDITPILEPVKAYRDRLVVLTGLDSKPGAGLDGGTHPRMQTSWLTGAPAKRTEGVGGVHAGVSMDQIVARETEKETQLASLELAMESVELLGSCFAGYSCAYQNTIAWRTATSPLPMENDPRAVFERLFGVSDSTDSRTRLADVRRQRSILDSIVGEANSFQNALGPNDRRSVNEYLDAVRDVERRIQKAEQQATKEIPVVTKPVGIPDTYGEHAAIMFDLMALAYQIDLTRVATFLLCREASTRSYPEIGIADSHHPLSHHGNDPAKLEKQTKINVFQMKLFADFLKKLASTPDGDGSLLDHTLLLYGSGMSDSNAHLPRNVPTLVVGGGSTFQISGGRHLKMPSETPLSDLQVTLLHKLGMPVEKFGDSDGELKLLSV